MPFRTLIFKLVIKKKLREKLSASPLSRLRGTAVWPSPQQPLWMEHTSQRARGARQLDAPASPRLQVASKGSPPLCPLLLGRACAAHPHSGDLGPYAIPSLLSEISERTQPCLSLELPCLSESPCTYIRNLIFSCWSVSVNLIGPHERTQKVRGKLFFLAPTL